MTCCACAHSIATSVCKSFATNRDFHDMASQQQVRSAPTYAFVTDYECDSNPAYGVVESRNQDSESPESGGRADPIPQSVTTEADTVSCDCMMYVPMAR